MTVLVGLDVGTTGVKALAIAPDGTCLATSEHGYPLAMPRPGWTEQDPEQWWAAAAAALDDVSAGREVAGIGLSGQMHGLVTLDGAGEVVRPAILWNDQRTGEECASIEATLGVDRLLALTGNRALPGFTAPKLLWLRRHEPDAYARIARICLPKDFVRLRLTGALATDVADASGTLLLDVGRRTWSDDVLSALDLPARWLPELFESQETTGSSAGGVPVAAGAGDCAAAALGVGVDHPGPASLVLGTSGVLFSTLPSFAPDPAGRLHVFCHAVPGAWHAMGVMLSAAGSLQWLRDTIAPSASFDELMAEAARAPAGTDGLLFLPYLGGERTPHVDPDARAAFVGLQVRHDRGALVRAVLEGVAYGLRDALELMRQAGIDVARVRASGGGARSELWLRICAAVLGVPVERPVIEEGSAFGAALLGGVTCGVFTDVHDAVAATVRTRNLVEPDRSWRGVYDEGYVRYRRLYPATREVEGR